MIQSLLFDLPAPPARPAPARAHRPAAPRAPRPPAPLDRDLFAAPARRPATRRAPSGPPFPLASKDTFGEWTDAHAWEHHEVLAHLECLPNDYYASVGYLRSQRPRKSGPALQFWTAPLSRAHLLNALLNRGERSVVQLERDCDLGEDKVYTYTKRWKLNIERPDTERTALLLDAAGARHTVHLHALHRENGTATVRLNGYQLLLHATFDTRLRVFRTAATVDAQESHLTYPVAALLANLTPGTVRHMLEPDLLTERGTGLLRTANFERLCPRQNWHTTMERALTLTNACRCAFWDHHDLRCGLDARRALPEAGTAPYACEDHHA